MVKLGSLSGEEEANEEEETEKQGEYAYVWEALTVVSSCSIGFYFLRILEDCEHVLASKVIGRGLLVSQIQFNLHDD